MSDPWGYELWPSRAHLDWGDAVKGDSPWDNLDFHVDLGCGTVPKARIGVDRYAAPGVAIVAELDCHKLGARTFSVAAHPGEDAPAPHAPTLRGHRGHTRGLPFSTSSIKSIVSHHFFEHVGDGFVALVEEIYRVLEPDGILRAITPLFPSTSAVEDPDHCRYFMARSWDCFCGSPDSHWMDSFSVPYCNARFEKVDQDMTPPLLDVSEWWGPHDRREIRVALKVIK